MSEVREGGGRGGRFEDIYSPGVIALSSSWNAPIKAVSP